jgi:hypothetical protein
MKVTVKTIKGWANNTDYIASPNTTNNTFLENLDNYVKEQKLYERGFKTLNTAFYTLRGVQATEKIVIKGRYWAGAWSDSYKQTFTVFYK